MITEVSGLIPLRSRIASAGILMFTLALPVASAPLEGQQTALDSDYLVPFPAHHVIGNIYFVGSKGLGIYLVTTPQGHILINPGLEDSVPGIQNSVESLGFHFTGINILLISHAHFDHDAGADQATDRGQVYGDG